VLVEDFVADDVERVDTVVVFVELLVEGEVVDFEGVVVEWDVE
jgi:hypothetical protein